MGTVNGMHRNVFWCATFWCFRLICFSHPPYSYCLQLSFSPAVFSFSVSSFLFCFYNIILYFFFSPKASVFLGFSFSILSPMSVSPCLSVSPLPLLYSPFSVCFSLSLSLPVLPPPINCTKGCQTSQLQHFHALVSQPV